MQPGFHVAVIIPTGIGAAIGGGGGDAMTLLPCLASICDTVITHPNVANAACFQTLPANTLYVEGYGLDQFFRGQTRLYPVRQNRLGVVWDSGISPEMRQLHENAIAAVRTVYGVDIVGLVETSEPIKIVLETQASGRSAGRVQNPDVLLAAALTLVTQGAKALAACCRMPVEDCENEDDAYQTGGGVDPIGGIEAMISHLLVAQLGLPVAHVPVFSYEEALPVVDKPLDPRTAAEFIVSTFLPCVLTGLSRAPQFSPPSANARGLSVDDLSALLVPADALGSVPVLSAAQRGIRIYAVENNRTVMQAPAHALQLQDKVTPCHNYMEAMGFLVAQKAGITLPLHFAADPAKDCVADTAVYAKA